MKILSVLVRTCCVLCYFYESNKVYFSIVCWATFIIYKALISQNKPVVGVAIQNTTVIVFRIHSNSLTYFVRWEMETNMNF